MSTILIILGIGAAIGVILAIANKESPLAGAMHGGCMAGSCMVQLLIPVLMLLAGLWLLSAIVG